MPATSLVKFMDQTHSGGKELHWGRADRDNAPFEGSPPVMTEEEAEERLVRTGNPHIELFDLDHPDAAKRYQEVLDRIVNGWCQCLHREVLQCRRKTTQDDGSVIEDVKIKVYMEWVEWTMRDGAPMLSQHPGLASLTDE